MSSGASVCRLCYVIVCLKSSGRKVGSVDVIAVSQDLLTMSCYMDRVPIVAWHCVIWHLLLSN